MPEPSRVAIPQRFVATHAYVRSLPDGFRSFPECRVRAEVFADIRDLFPKIGEERDLPEPVLRFFAGEPETGWMPEVLGQTVHLLARDTALRSDEALLRWSYETSQRLFQQGFFRHLMKLLSPTLVVMGSSQRWGTLHAGSTLTAGKLSREGGECSTVGTLTFPSGLFPELFLRGLAGAFQAAIEGARAENVRVTLARVQPGRAEYLTQWR